MLMLACGSGSSQTAFPDPLDPLGVGPADPPAVIKSFAASLDPKQGHPEITLYRFPEDGSDRSVPSEDSVVLDAGQSAEVLIHLTSPFSYSASSGACGDYGFGMRLISVDKTLDLAVSRHCRFLEVLPEGGETGLLSKAAQEYFERLYREAFPAAN